jgi:DNA-binding response OmpR family regulator
MQQLLMIEDDARLAQMVGEYLERSGFGVTHALDAKAGMALLQDPPTGATPDLVILDLMLPDMDGLEVCRRLRALPGAVGQVPVLMLTAKGDPMDRIVGLELGADDYLPKPFSPRELLARLRAVVRRTQANGERRQFSVSGVRVDLESRRVERDGRSLELTGLEFDLLVALMQRAGRVVARTSLLELAGRNDVSVNDRAVDVHVSHLRRKLGDDPPRLICTVRGVGYMFVRDEA